MRTILVMLSLAATALPLAAQQGSFVYRLGKDTIAIEQFTRTAARMSGDMVQRTGLAVVRVQYEMTLGADGRPTAATVRRMQGDGSPITNNPTETRLRFTPDSVVREVVWADSVQRRAFAVPKALVNFPTFIYAPAELIAAIKRGGGAADSIPAVGINGNPTFVGLEAMRGDTVRLRGTGYPMVMRIDAGGRLQSVDGSATTNKAIATRGPGGLDIAAIARAMKPTGALSVRDVARAAFGPGGFVLIDYGRPLVRERTVWGGVLVPFDSIWRAGANDATHLVTTRALTFGTLAVPAGTYTLWVQHTRAGTSLIINKQTGQWGTQYDPTHDLGRVPLQLTPIAAFTEEFTVTVRNMGGNRGALELAWGPSMASTQFTVSAARP